MEGRVKSRVALLGPEDESLIWRAALELGSRRGWREL